MKSPRTVLTIFFNFSICLNQVHSSNLNECVLKTVRNVFGQNESIIYMYGSDHAFPILDENPKILFDARSQMIVPTSYKDYSHNYVIRADSHRDLVNAFYALGVSKLWNNKFTREGKFLFVTFDEDLEEKVTLFWSKGLINLIVLTYDFGGTMIVFTGDPQATQNSCGRAFKQVLSVNNCFGTTTIQLPKVSRKYTNCNVTYLTRLKNPSTAIKFFASIDFVLRLLVEQFNVSLKTINTLKSNYSYDLFTIYIQYRSPFDQSVYTSTLFSDGMVWIVPFPSKIPDMETIKIIFKNDVWIFVLISFVATSITWFLITRFLKGDWNFSEAFLKVFSITLFGSVDQFDLFRSMRCLFLAYVLYSIHIQTAFVSKLVEVLTVPQYESTIKTLTELSDSNLKIFVSTTIYDHFFQHEVLNSTLYNKIRNKFEVQSSGDFSGTITDLKTFRNSGALVTSNEIDILTAVFLIDFYTIEDPTLVSNIDRVVSGPSGSYLIKTIDNLISNLAESGILRYYLKNVKYTIPITRTKDYSENKILSLQDVYVVFVFCDIEIKLLSIDRQQSKCVLVSRVVAMKLPPIVVAAMFFNIVVASNQHNSKLNKCIIKTVRNVFANNESIIYMYDKNNRIPTTDENPRILFDVRNQITVSPSYGNYTHNYVIRANYYVDLSNAFIALISSRLWCHHLTLHGKFILITMDENLEKMVTLFWKFGVINLIVIFYNSDGTMIVFTSDPQAPSNNCGLMLKTFLNFDDCFASRPVQLPKILRKYTNCNMTHFTWRADDSYTMKLSGSTKFLWDLMVEKYNVTMTTIDTSKTNRSKDLFSVSIQFRQPSDFNMYTSTFFSNKMVWIVPFPKRISDIKIISMIFKNSVWISILIALVAASLVWWLITKVMKRTSSITKAFLKVYSITLFGSVDSFDWLRPTLCLFLAYVMYSIHIQTAFVSKLVEVLTIPQYESAIKTLDELSDSDVTIYVSKYVYHNFFKHESLNNTLYNKIKNKLSVQTPDDFGTLVTDFKTFMRSAVLLTSNEMNILRTIFFVDFCTVEDDSLITNLDLAIVGRPGSYLIKTIDKLISDLMESGILHYIINNIKYDIPVNMRKIYSSFTVISLQHLYVVFVYWFIGLGLSGIVFLFELIYFKVKS
ncbi:hypothetical protein FQR65_LT09872 [Abscondita terminalis]|nr:hypothetical protein FQR65_LT09872 [Abscondita terminalis]